MRRRMALRCASIPRSRSAMALRFARLRPGNFVIELDGVSDNGDAATLIDPDSDDGAEWKGPLSLPSAGELAEPSSDSQAIFPSAGELAEPSSGPQVISIPESIPSAGGLAEPSSGSEMISVNLTPDGAVEQTRPPLSLAQPALVDYLGCYSLGLRRRKRKHSECSQMASVIASSSAAFPLAAYNSPPRETRYSPTRETRWKWKSPRTNRQVLLPVASQMEVGAPRCGSPSPEKQYLLLDDNEGFSPLQPVSHFN